MLISLKKLIEVCDPEELNAILSTFSCKLDEDIENFLKERAPKFEALLKSRTYLVCDRDEMKKGNVVILAYFSLALKTLSLPGGLSIRNRQNIDGFSGKIHGEPVTEIPCYLIGQLGKNSAIQSGVSGATVLNYAMDIIGRASEAVGGRWTLIECSDTPALVQFYKNNHFRYIGNLSVRDEPLLQMIRKNEA